MKTRDAGIRATVVMGLVASSLAMAPGAYAQKAKPKKTAPIAAAAPAPDAKPIDKAQLAEAKKRYTSGTAKFKAGDFDGALQDFQAADAIKATPQTAKFIGSCLDSLGRFPEAVTAYQRFLANPPASAGAQVDVIKSRVATIQLLPGMLHVTSDPSSTSFSVDGKAQPNPTPTEVEVPPGHHTIHFEAPDHDPVDKEVDVTFASRQNVDATLPSNLPPPPPPAPVVVEQPAPAPAAAPAPAVVVGPPPTEASQSNTAAWITGGAAVVAVGIGTAFGILALNDKSNFNANPTTATADSGENHALIADMSFGVAVTLGVTSLVLFLSKDDAPPAAATSEVVTHKAKAASASKRSTFTITPSPILTPHGAGAGALIRF